MKTKTYRRKTRLSELPTELLQNIFCRLSVKTIYLQVRSVCKSWYAMVTDPSFISMRDDWWAKNHNGYLIFHHRSKIARLDERFNFAEELEFPIKGSELQLIGSCNGLVCLQEEYRYLVDRQRFPTTYIWNPSIKRAIKKLPDVPITRYQIEYRMTRCISAFGFDSQNNDYKVFHTTLCYLSFADHKWVIVNWLYSLKTNSWKVVKGDGPWPRHTCLARYPSTHYTWRTSSNEAFYWTPDMITRDSSCLMWFDFCDESIRKVKLPTDDYDTEGLYLMTVNNSIVLYVADIPQKGPCTILNAWMMKELSDQTIMWSWDEKLSAAIPSLELKEISSLKPLGIGMNGECLVLSYVCGSYLLTLGLFYQLGVYDFKEQILKDCDIHFLGTHRTRDWFHDSFSYSESLVFLEDAYREQNNNQLPIN